MKWNPVGSGKNSKHPFQTFSFFCIVQVWARCIWMRWSALDLRSPSQSVSSTRRRSVAATRRTQRSDVTFLLWASRSRWALTLFQSSNQQHTHSQERWSKCNTDQFVLHPTLSFQYSIWMCIWNRFEIDFNRCLGACLVCTNYKLDLSFHVFVHMYGPL